jgi:hypothetical protein
MSTFKPCVLLWNRSAALTEGEGHRTASTSLLRFVADLNHTWRVFFLTSLPT